MSVFGIFQNGKLVDNCHKSADLATAGSLMSNQSDLGTTAYLNRHDLPKLY